MSYVLIRNISRIKYNIWKNKSSKLKFKQTQGAREAFFDKGTITVGEGLPMDSEPECFFTQFSKAKSARK